jgi:hypothetical protein
MRRVLTVNFAYGIRLPGRKYFCAPGVYLTGIDDMRKSVLLRKLVSTLIQSAKPEDLEQLH